MTDALDFVKWLYDKGYVPNGSYLWFNYRAHKNDVVFFKIEELYKMFMWPQKEQDALSDIFSDLYKNKPPQP